MTSFRKIFLEQRHNHDDCNIRYCQPIDDAAWVWHPELAAHDQAFVRFHIGFESKAVEVLRCHVSGDQRYELLLDGERISRGPERSDVMHWSYSSYEIDLAAGEHELEAVVWNLADDAPNYMMTYRPGFIFKAEGKWDELLTTGKGEWSATELKGWSLTGIEVPNSYHVVGKSLQFDGREWFSDAEAMTAEIVRPVLWSNDWGACAEGWRLRPAQLPDQLSDTISCGTLRAVINNWHDDYLIQNADCLEEKTSVYAGIFRGEPIQIPASTKVALLWDLEDYYCGYGQANLNGGTGSVVTWLWAESLFEDDLVHKGNRDEVVGKRFLGFGERFVSDGEMRTFSSHRWLSGRYVLLVIETGDTPLTIDRLAVEETRYPLENESSFECSDESLQSIIQLCTRVLQMCSHDSYLDCPYYEQLQYGGDTRLEILAHYAINRDDRLPKRAIDIYDFSRYLHGHTSGSWPTRHSPLLTTFSMIFTWKVHDYLYWRGSVEWLRERIPAVRSTLDLVSRHMTEEGLLGPLPGWSFVDWVEEWENAWVPGSKDAPSAPLNLIYYLSLRKAADLERVLGEELLSARYQQLADSLGEKIKSTFYQTESGLLSDDLGGKHYSQHSQCLAIVSGLYEGDAAQALFDSMLNHKPISKTTVYFSHYLMEAMNTLGRGELIQDKFAFWHELEGFGLKTVLERPEPSRSDCHAWGAYPVFHMHASLLGVRPASVGFKSVTIAPNPGTLSTISASTPHPNGDIVCNLTFTETGTSGTVVLPEGISGTFVWRNESIPLSPGENKISL